MSKTTATINLTVPLSGGGAATVTITPPFSVEDGTFIRGLIYGAVSHLSETQPTPEPVKVTVKKKAKAHGLSARKYPKILCVRCGGKYAEGQGMKAHLRKCIQTSPSAIPADAEVYTNGINTVWQNA